MSPSMTSSPMPARRPTHLAALTALLAGMALSQAAPAQDGLAADRGVASVEVQAPSPAQALPTAMAEAVAAPNAPHAAALPPPRRQIDIGRATDRLLSLQTAPAQAQAPRPIPGEQARRSYARYLKSFETEIPALYKTGSDSGGRN